MEHAVLQMGIILLKLFDLILNILSLGISVHWTWILAHGQLIFILESNDIRLCHKQEGAYDRQVHAVQVGVR